MIQLLREEGFLNKSCDAIMTSSVPNLVHVIRTLVRRFTSTSILGSNF